MTDGGPSAGGDPANGGEPGPTGAHVARYWDEQHQHEESPDSFLDHPLIQFYVSMRAFGTTTAQTAAVIESIRTRTTPGSRLLSVGCGTAQKEESLATSLPDREFVAMDIAEATLATARERLAQRGVHNLALTVGDFNDFELPAASFDMILGLGAIHHVEQLESFWATCAHGLKSGGTVLAQEYVGASRFQWTPRQLEFANELFQQLPEEHRLGHTEVPVVDLEEIIAIDPSEAVRSDELVPTCRASELEIREGEYYGAGCGVLQPALTLRMHTFDPTNWRHNKKLFEAFALEERYYEQGLVPDTYAMWLATKR